jgi:hypothetical protein
MANVRDRFWPKLIEAPEKDLATGGLAALALSYIGFLEVYSLVR